MSGAPRIEDPKTLARFCLGATILERHKQARPKRIVEVKRNGVWAENEHGRQHFIRTATLRRFDVLGSEIREIGPS